MKKYTIASSESVCRTLNGGFGICLLHDTIAYYHSDYSGGGKWRINGTVENLICTLKNDIIPYSSVVLQEAKQRLGLILKADLPIILRDCGKDSLRVCVIPRAKREDTYRQDQLYFRETIQAVVHDLRGFENGTHDIIRHTDTVTTHRAKSGYGGAGEKPYIGITKDTCTISDEVINKDILLIDDLYTKSVNIDEDCIQALFDKGARNVFFYSIGKTMLRF